MRSSATHLPVPRLTARDATAEAVAGIVQRPGRAAATARAAAGAAAVGGGQVGGWGRAAGSRGRG